MVDSVHLLPERNSTPFEQAFSLSTDVYALTDPSVSSMRGLKIRNPPPSFLPYLVYEYGLGELTPYLPNLYDLIEEGIDWQRVRGSPAAVYRALGWLDFSGAVEEPAIRRMRWNLFQLELSRVRDDDELDLPRIEGVVQLSAPIRSVFWRGFRGYDIRALEYGWTKWSAMRWGAYSGARLPLGQVKWSFGRVYDTDHAMTDEELEALDVYLPPAGDGPTPWWTFPWPDVPWIDDASVARSAAMLSALTIGTAWVVFKRANGSVIGYRRARSVHRVAPASNGVFRVGSSRFNRQPTGPTILYVEAMTDFSDGFGQEAASVGVIFNATPTGSNPLGALWVPAGGLSQTGPIISPAAFEIEFGRTVRERVRFALRF